MNKKVLFVLIFFFVNPIFAQTEREQEIQRKSARDQLSQRGEVYFSFKVKDRDVLNKLSRIISIDKIDTMGKAFAYANRKGFDEFLKFLIEPSVLTPPSMLEEHTMLDVQSYRTKAANSKENFWNTYPSYETYIAMMSDFQSNFPFLCEVVEIGTTVQNRKLLACKITSNDSVSEAGNGSKADGRKVKIFYSSTMHGDETTGYVLMLRLIDYLLNNYAEDARIKNILDNAEIWICPNANPDGTYRTGNGNVTGATRYNTNSVDLNRNYKDDLYGDHPDGERWQLETRAFMAFQAEQKFHLAMNIHGGAEVCNYPWDNKYTLTADDDWWKFVCKEYVDTARIYRSSYMKDVTNSGITNGADWYVITGSRQDYANYYNRCREFTLEISTIKTLSASNLPNYWNYNYRSFLNFMEQGLYGIHGRVADLETGFPLQCEVRIEGHDDASSYIYSDSNSGYYARPIKGGVYTVSYTADGYETETREITISDRQRVVEDIELKRKTVDMASLAGISCRTVRVYPNPAKDIINIEAESTIKKVEITDMFGKRVFSQFFLVQEAQDKVSIKTDFIKSGMYLIRLHFDNGYSSSKVVIL
ncbi:MAG: T9SS type A sorting domain-containing protein [Bacteroidales bacterium]|jgi:hypothetical protein|nr:T9SS type A sorting domain-containing protein [Bacteroidales bacterium]